MPSGLLAGKALRPCLFAPTPCTPALLAVRRQPIAGVLTAAALAHLAAK
eukprot:COSAG05_NODE_8995_length_655_cov_1.654676_1_plen_48_part_01